MFVRLTQMNDIDTGRFVRDIGFTPRESDESCYADPVSRLGIFPTLEGSPKNSFSPQRVQDFFDGFGITGSHLQKQLKNCGLTPKQRRDVEALQAKKKKKAKT